MESMANWKQQMLDEHGLKTAHIECIQGNGLEIDPTQGECLVGFDRIYVGASIEKASLNKFTSLLRPGGVLVAPGMYESR